MAAGGEPWYVNIQAGYAACLQDSLYETLGPETAGNESGNQDTPDRSQLIMQLLLHAACNDSPSLTHLLMGYNINNGMLGTQPALYRLLGRKLLCRLVKSLHGNGQY